MEQVEVKFEPKINRYVCTECNNSFFQQRDAQRCADFHLNIKFLKSLPVGSVVYSAQSDAGYNMYRIVRLDGDRVEFRNPGSIATTPYRTASMAHLSWHYPWMSGWLEANNKTSETRWKAKHKQSIERKIKTAQTKLDQLNKALEILD